jgi:hypothetical protein
MLLPLSKQQHEKNLFYEYSFELYIHLEWNLSDRLAFSMMVPPKYGCEILLENPLDTI